MLAFIIGSLGARGVLQEQQELTPPNPAPDDAFGSAVSLSIDGACLAVGAPQVGSNPVSGYVLTWKCGTGSCLPLAGNAVPYVSSDVDNFGSSVSFSGDGSALAVGACLIVGAGAPGSPQGAVFICKSCVVSPGHRPLHPPLNTAALCLQTPVTLSACAVQPCRR